MRRPRKTETETEVADDATETSQGPAVFISNDPEPMSFPIMGILPYRFQEDTTRLAWEVPGDLVERFSRHHFVVMGRIYRAD